MRVDFGSPINGIRPVTLSFMGVTGFGINSEDGPVSFVVTFTNDFGLNVYGFNNYSSVFHNQFASREAFNEFVNDWSIRWDDEGAIDRLWEEFYDFLDDAQELSESYDGIV